MCNSDGNCIAETLEKVLLIQQQSNSVNNLGCERPFQTTTTPFNTRPINLYSCCNNELWNMPYTFNGTTATSTTFRIENINDNFATFRILIVGENNAYTATDNFFTINLKNIVAIKCLNDVFISNI